MTQQHTPHGNGATGKQKAAALATVTVVGGALVVNGSPAQAADFEVTNLDPSGPGSFAQAVEDANALNDLDEITFAPGLNGTISLDDTANIKYDLSIVGPGDGSIVLSNADNDLLYVYNSASLTVTGLTIGEVDGDGIRAEDAGDVEIDDLEFDGANRAVDVEDSGAVTLTNSTVTGTASTAIDVDRAGAVVISGIDIEANTNPFGYGYNSAIRIDQIVGDVSVTGVVADGEVSVRDVEADGGAMNGDVVVSDVTVDAPGFGGLGVSQFEGHATVEQIEVSSDLGAGMYLRGESVYGGGQFTSFGTATMSDVTVSAGGAFGAFVVMSSLEAVTATDIEVEGGIALYNVTDADISSTTLAGSDGTGIPFFRIKDQAAGELYAEAANFVSDGQVISVANSTALFTQVTVTENASGATLRLNDADVSFAHSTIASNELSGPNIFVTAPSSISLDHTIFADAHGDGFEFGVFYEGDRRRAAPLDSAVLDVDATHSVVPTGVVADYSLDGTNVETDDVKLGPLQDNGGSLPTAAPLPGSPAIDAGDPAVTGAPPLDQRGAERIVDVIDIGAVETTALLHSIPPARYVDTRSGPKTFDGEYEGDGKRPSGSTYEVQIAGRGDVPDGATAVVMNVTAIAGEVGGFLTAFACDDPQPNASSINFNGANVGNEIIAGLAADGTICLFVQGSAHLTVDVVAYADELSSLKPITPARSFESRIGKTTADGRFQGTGQLPAGSQVTIPIAGRNGVPEDAETVVVNLTAIRPESGGFLTAHPCLPTVPNTSSLNFDAGVVRANEIVAQLNEFGELCVFTSAATHLAVDVSAYLPPGAIESAGPARLLDTRSTGMTVDGAFQGGGTAAAGTTTELVVAGRAGIPDEVKAVVVNVTAIRPSDRGFVTVDGCGDPRPTASSLNHEPGVNTPNEIIAGVSDDGTICLFNNVATDLAVDVVAFIR